MMEHINRAHKREDIGEQYSKLLPMPCNFDCGHRFKFNATKSMIDQHMRTCPSRPGNFDPIAAEDGHAEETRNIADEKERMANFYEAFANTNMEEARHWEGRPVQRIDRDMTGIYRRQNEKLARGLLLIEDDDL